MIYDVVLTRKAERQIASTVRWWANHRSAAQAERWYQGLMQTLKSLQHDPKRCALAPEHGALPLPIRQITYGVGRKPTHRVLFAIRGQRVVVYAVRHLAQRDIRPEDL
jgi:plasmid stabilization system protein ParE